MPFFMDRHDLANASAADVAAAHVSDLGIQDEYGVRYLTYWFDYERQRAYCLASGPDRETVLAVHRESHGLLPSEVLPVEVEEVERFLGPLRERPAGEAYVATAFRIILFTDLVGSTRLTQQLGDSAAMQLLHDHDRAVRRAVEDHGGSVIKHTGDGMMVAFGSVGAALEAATAIQRTLQERNRTAQHPLGVRMGLAAGEPVMEHGDLFGASVQLAARLCDSAEPGTVLVSNAVRDLAVGKRFPFLDRGERELKGFDEPVRLFELGWDTASGVASP